MNKNPEDEKWVRRAMKEDEEFIQRGKMRDAIWGIPIIPSEGNADVAEQLYRKDVFEALDALPPVPQGKDCVERDEVRKLLLTIQAAGKFGEDIATELRSEGKKVTHIKVDLLTELAKLPSAVPARRARVDEEIKAAQKIFEDMAKQMLANSKGEGISEEDKAVFKGENITNWKLAQLCRWFQREKSVFDLMFKKLLGKEAQDESNSSAR